MICRLHELLCCGAHKIISGAWDNMSCRQSNISCCVQNFACLKYTTVIDWTQPPTQTSQEFRTKYTYNPKVNWSFFNYIPIQGEITVIQWYTLLKIFSERSLWYNICFAQACFLSGTAARVSSVTWGQLLYMHYL